MTYANAFAKYGWHVGNPLCPAAHIPAGLCVCGYEEVLKVLRKPRLETKQASGGLDYFGPGTGYTEPHPLYRFVSDEDQRGCWYTTVEKAAEVWNRHHKGDEPVRYEVKVTTTMEA